MERPGPPIVAEGWFRWPRDQFERLSEVILLSNASLLHVYYDLLEMRTCQRHMRWEAWLAAVVKEFNMLCFSRYLF